MPLLPITFISSTHSAVLSRAGFGALYFVGFQGQPDSAPLKVGSAHDVHKRFTSLRTGNWQQIGISEILFVNSRFHEIVQRRVKDLMFLGKMDEADQLTGHEVRRLCSINEVEAAVHERFDELGLRHSGEWFTSGAANLVAVAKDVIENVLGIEYVTCRSMKRKLKMWEIEAQEAKVSQFAVHGASRIVRCMADRRLQLMKSDGGTKLLTSTQKLNRKPR